MIIMLFLIAFISAENNSNKESKILLKQCAKECKMNKTTICHNCISDHKTESMQIRKNYKICTKNIKEDFKNNSINKTELKAGTKNCTRNYLIGLKESDKKEKECFKNSQINCEKKCKGETNNGEENGNKPTTKCLERSEICPSLYEPVCGWFNSSIQCLVYPCASEYSNSCVACSDIQVDYWTPGQCPKK